MSEPFAGRLVECWGSTNLCARGPTAMRERRSPFATARFLPCSGAERVSARSDSTKSNERAARPLTRDVVEDEIVASNAQICGARICATTCARMRHAPRCLRLHVPYIRWTRNQLARSFSCGTRLVRFGSLATRGGITALRDYDPAPINGLRFGAEPHVNPRGLLPCGALRGIYPRKKR